MTTAPPGGTGATVVDPATVAASIGLTYTALTTEQQTTLVEAILDAQADVEAYLGRTIVPAAYVQTGVVQSLTGLWDLPEQPVVSVDLVTAETDPVTGRPTGTYTINYHAGLDARTADVLRPIRRYVSLHATLVPQVTRLSAAARPIQSVNVEGQGVTFGDGPVHGRPIPHAAPMPGALPTMETLDRWRIRNRRAYQRKGSNLPIVEPTAWRG